MFFPSTYPSWRKPSRKALRRSEFTAVEAVIKNPIRGSAAGCCASAEPQRAKSKAHEPEIRSRRSDIGFGTEAQTISLSRGFGRRSEVGFKTKQQIELRARSKERTAEFLLRAIFKVDCGITVRNRLFAIRISPFLTADV
jgi:hypothetical protein